MISEHTPAWTLVISTPGRPSRSIRVGRARIYGSLLAVLAGCATTLWLGWQLGEATRLL